MIWSTMREDTSTPSRLSDDGRWLAWGDRRGAWLLDVATRRVRRVLDATSVCDLAFDPDSRRLAIGVSEYEGQLWIVDRLPSGKPRRLIPKPARSEEALTRHGAAAANATDGFMSLDESPVGSDTQDLRFSPDGLELHYVVGVGSHSISALDGTPVEDPLGELSPFSTMPGSR